MGVAEHVQVRLAKPGGGFHQSTSGIDPKIAQKWAEDGKCEIVGAKSAKPEKRGPGRPKKVAEESDDG